MYLWLIQLLLCVILIFPHSTSTPALDASCSSVNTSLTGVYSSPVSLESGMEDVCANKRVLIDL